MEVIPKEVGIVLRCLYYIIDENINEIMGNKVFYENMLNNILVRYEVKYFKSILVNYWN